MRALPIPKLRADGQDRVAHDDVVDMVSALLEGAVDDPEIAAEIDQEIDRVVSQLLQTDEEALEHSVPEAF